MNTQEERDLLVAQTMYDLMILSVDRRNRLFGAMHPITIFETYTLSHIRRSLNKDTTCDHRSEELAHGKVYSFVREADVNE